MNSTGRPASILSAARRERMLSALARKAASEQALAAMI
jgi:hypothetical protein